MANDTKQYPAKRQTKAEKQVKKNKTAAQATTKPPKVKGPAPGTYTMNRERKARHAEQEAARMRKLQEGTRQAQLDRNQADLKAMQMEYSSIMAAVPGEYKVGNIDEDGKLHFAVYKIKMIPSRTGDREYPAIFGFRDVHIRHSDLFAEKEDIMVLDGWKGEVQVAMLNTLRGTLASDIAAVNRARVEQSTTVKRQAPRLVTENGKQVAHASVYNQAVLPLAKFTPETIGRFSFAEGVVHCYVDQMLVDGDMTIRIVKIPLWFNTFASPLC